MNETTESIAAIEHAVADTADQVPGYLLRNAFLPKMIYEALPAAYMSIGTLLVLGAVYVGIGEWTMVGYMATGAACIFAGVAVNGIRRKERLKS